MEQVLDVYQQPFFITYSMGLRLVEALSLQVKDIYAAQMRIHIRLGKNKKDRYVTLPLLALLAMRHYWQTHHHPMLLFPAGSTTRERFRATKHMSKSGVQRTIKKIASDAGIRTNVTPHTLRHGNGFTTIRGRSLCDCVVVRTRIIRDDTDLSRCNAGDEGKGAGEDFTPIGVHKSISAERRVAGISQ